MPKLLRYLKQSVTIFFEYDTPRIVHIKNKTIGIINRIVQLVILAYIIGFVLVYKKGYQETDVVDSVVTTKVKGTLFTKNVTQEELLVQPNYTHLYQRVWDPADYVFPASGEEHGGFFVMTNVVITPDQKRDQCAEDPKIGLAHCRNDTDCPAGTSLEVGNGVMTGRCVKGSYTNVSTCEIDAWCPVERDQLPFNGTRALLEGSKNFTVLIKNAIEFAKFGQRYKRRNVLENSNSTYLQNCIYNHETDPFCPVFRLGDIVEGAGHNYSEIAIKGAVFAIRISWFCNLDFDFLKYCRPKYSFERMDSPNAPVAPGWNFRSAYFHEEGRRTLHKNYGIKFLVDVDGEAGKFNLVPLFLNVGSGLALLGLATIVCDCLVLYFFKSRDYYKDKKYLNVDTPGVINDADANSVDEERRIHPYIQFGGQDDHGSPLSP